MTGDQLGLLAKAHPRLTVPPDFDRRVSWHGRGPAAIASATGRTLADLGAPPRGDGALESSAVRGALERLGYNVVERPAVWPGFGLAMIIWDGPWTVSPLAGHWIAVRTDDALGGGEVWCPSYPDRVVFLDAWRRGYAHDLARLLRPAATGGWMLHVGLEIVARVVKEGS